MPFHLNFKPATLVAGFVFILFMSYKVEVVYSREFFTKLAKQSWVEGYAKGYLWYMAIPALGFSPLC